MPPAPPLNNTGVRVAPEQIVWSDGVATIPAPGFTCTVAVTGVPVQLLTTGVMVKVTVSGPPEVFVNTPLILPVPLAGMPVTKLVLSLVQL